MFIYCGHGCGVALHGLSPADSNDTTDKAEDRTTVSSSSAVASIKSKKQPKDHAALQLQRLPAAMLWGCSSGRLLPRGCHEPYGPVLPYLQHGASFVAANLWDVTDRDLDRLSLDCMERLLPPADHQSVGQQQVASCLAQARNVCKLRFAVGAAAVTYGLPAPLAEMPSLSALKH